MSTLSAALTQADYRANTDKGSPKITPDDVATIPRPGTMTPTSIHFFTSRNDANEKEDVFVTYLSSEDAGSLTRKLYAAKVNDRNDADATERTKIDLFSGLEGAGGEDSFSLEEKLRRERARMMSTGVTSYAWNAGANNSDNNNNNRMVLVPFSGALWLLDDPLTVKEGETTPPPPPRKLVETNKSKDNNEDDFHALPVNAPLLDAKISADGSTVAFVAGEEVYVIATTSKNDDNSPPPRRLTSGARGVEGVSNGVADYLAQEELERADGFWLAPRGTKIAFEQVDQCHIPSYRITHQGEGKGLSPALAEGNSCADVAVSSTVTYEEHRYPFAGAVNPKVKLGVVDTQGNDDEGSTSNNVMWFDLDHVFGDDFYLGKVEWLPAPSASTEDSTKLAVQLLDRRQQTVALVVLDCETGSSTIIHVEKAIEGGWINLNNAFRPLQIEENDDTTTMQFLWGSERRDGYQHLFILEADLKKSVTNEEAKVVRRLTGPGEFIVEEVLAVDKDRGFVYYMGTKPEKWLERHLFRVSIDTDEASSHTECLTDSVPGQHSCVVHVDSGFFVDTVSSVDRPPVTTVQRLPLTAAAPSSVAEEVKIVLELHDAGKADPRVSELGRDVLTPPTFHTFPSTDGEVQLQAAVYLPDEEKWGKGPFPLVVATYGGPHVQYVQDSWSTMTADSRSQFLRSNGFAVIKCDNRGSFRRGIAFEKYIYGKMGSVEVDDQAAAVAWAVQQNIADVNRVAVVGWSYGGYMALKCLTERPDVFHAGVAGAPVTDWTLYDTAYTERYMGLPQENVEGYQKSSALANVANIRGSLLLCHGLLDENVLFRQSAVLLNELIEHRIAHDLVLFPSERHGPRRQQDRAFLEERILAFFQRTLGRAGQ